MAYSDALSLSVCVVLTQGVNIIRMCVVACRSHEHLSSATVMTIATRYFDLFSAYDHLEWHSLLDITHFVIAIDPEIWRQLHKFLCDFFMPEIDCVWICLFSSACIHALSHSPSRARHRRLCLSAAPTHAYTQQQTINHQFPFRATFTYKLQIPQVINARF